MSLHAITLAAVAVSQLVPAVALLRAGRARQAALAMTMTSLVLLLGVALEAAGHQQGAERSWLAAALLLGPLSLVLYPVARWREPVDFLTVVLVGAAGSLATLVPETAETMTFLLVLVGIPAHIWWRLEHALADERRALTWMALAAGSSTLIAGLVAFAAGDSIGSVAAEAFFVVIGPAMYVGAARSDLADARDLIVPVVTYLTTAVTYLALFVGVAATIEELGDGATPTVAVLGLCAAVLAATFHPMQVLLRGVVDEVLFGVRPDPLDAAGLVSGRIGEDPIVALRAIREALVLPYAALRVDGEVTVSSGKRVTHTAVRALPSTTGATLELEVALRPGDVALSAADRQVLDIATPLLAQSLRASALAADLQHSRQQTIAAREEERRGAAT